MVKKLGLVCVIMVKMLFGGWPGPLECQGLNPDSTLYLSFLLTLRWEQ